MVAVNNVTTWKDGIRAHTNNNRESANNDAFSRFWGRKQKFMIF
jgi:hypothetical protein